MPKGISNMHTILIKTEKKTQVYPLDKGLTTIGSTTEYDIPLGVLKDSAISLLAEPQSVRVLPEIQSVKVKGSWNKGLENPTVFKGPQFEIIVLPNIVFQSKDKFDLDFSKLPQIPKAADYPEKLLEFLLASLGASQGGLFHHSADTTKVLASKNLQMKDKKAHLIGELIKDNEATYHEVDGLTHTSIFQANTLAESFLLLRSPLPTHGEVILYIQDHVEAEVPRGLIKSLLHLATQGISLHLIHHYNQRFKSRLTPQFTDKFFFGAQEKMLHLKSVVGKLAPTDLALVVNGETGTGKELLANYVVENSRHRKLVALNCGAIAKELAESTLFGHKKGAFTGANQDYEGKIAQAHRGTLFLDEIGELSLDIQAKLLRVLQNKKVSPLGGQEKAVEFRLITATHRDLQQMVREGKFREDLYFRISEATLQILPLRMRRKDIPLMAQGFLADTIKINHLKNVELHPNCSEFFAQYAFPGNVRELRSLIRRCAVLCEEGVIEYDLLSTLAGPVSNRPESHEGFPLNLALGKQLFIQKQVSRALEQADGNKTKAAALLGITPRSLFRYISDNSGTEKQAYQ